jgi:serine/threonine protein kinase
MYTYNSFARVLQIIHGGGRKGLPENKAQFYAAGIAEGLGYMHRRGYVYRDLKPENVLIGSDGYTVIVDFGFAKYVSDKVRRISVAIEGELRAPCTDLTTLHFPHAFPFL